MTSIAICCGPSGSGKSTWADKLVKKLGAVKLSADDYFMVDGKYVFSPISIGEAHAQCLRKFVGALIACEEDIIVDNTNLKPIDMAPYVRLAEAFGYDVEIHMFDGENPNIHGVPLDKVKKMREEYATLKLSIINKDGTDRLLPFHTPVYIHGKD
jgi:predicted kinase